MAQHDYDLVNAPTLTVRSEFNSILEAVLSTNSGPLAPIEIYAGMLWFDETTEKLWLRHAVDATWHELQLDIAFLPVAGGTIAGNLTVNGSFSNPDFDRLVVNYIGVAPPASPLPGMLWYDTSVTPNVLRVRNKTNAAWLVALDLSAPIFTDAVTIQSTGQAGLTLKSQGVLRSLINDFAADRLAFWLNGSSVAAAYLTDAGVLQLRGNSYANLATVIAGLQPTLGFTPIRRSGANVPSIGGVPAHLYIDGADQGEIQYGPAPITLLERAALGALTYAGPLSGVAATPGNGTLAGSQLTYMPDRAVIGVGTWRNLAVDGIVYSGSGVFQRIA